MALFNFTPASILPNAILGIELLLGSFDSNKVAIHDQDTFDQLFADANEMRIDVRETSKVMDHPVETGVTLSDHHVINPVQIELSLIIKSQFYASTFQQIKSAFVNATLLAVQTNAGVYSNMIIAELPHEEDPEMFDAIKVGLRLREVLFVAPASITQTSGNVNLTTASQDYAPANPENGNTVNRGLQTPKYQADTPAQQQALDAYLKDLGK